MKIAVCGGAPTSIHLAPYEDESWQIWGCSPGSVLRQLETVTKRSTHWFEFHRSTARWFELHKWEPDMPWHCVEYVKFLKAFPGSVYTGGPIPEIPNHVIYPLERVEHNFTAYFLSSSISLMLALAILEIEDSQKSEPDDKPKTPGMIGIYGVDMGAGTEWYSQRSGCHFFILEALRRGINIFVPEESCLLRPAPVYGLCEWDHEYAFNRQRSRELTEKITEAKKTIEDNENRVNVMTGIANDMDYWLNIWNSPYGFQSGKILKGRKL